jgi:hypothetical protein
VLSGFLSNDCSPLFLPSKYTQASDFEWSPASMSWPKYRERNKIIFSVGHVVSGHTLKHLAATEQDAGF